MPVGRLWGVGKVTGQVFDKLAIRTIGQLRRMSPQTLSDLFGASGEHYFKLAHGLDDRRVVPDREAKSVSNETTFAEDIADMEVLKAWLVELVEHVARFFPIESDSRGARADLERPQQRGQRLRHSTQRCLLLLGGQARSLAFAGLERFPFLDDLMARHQRWPPRRVCLICDRYT